ncbi:hypothetical protein [Chryseobacterium oranimense]|uniref:hypothetical protein n=1 Tax=Chryseobacterium oranimense TaxID=421058 RepID=UPI002236C00D|nr:hypothetical protein [Chryseobacterium oranimense]
MEKQFYVVYLNPSRPDSAMSMTDSEKTIIIEHVAYWTEKECRSSGHIQFYFITADKNN